MGKGKKIVGGEILSGHFSTYKAFIYPKNGLTKNQIDLCLQNIRPGNFDEGNQIWRCAIINGQWVLIAAYSAIQRGSKVGADYCHARYVKLTPQILYCHYKENIYSKFAGEKDFLAVAKEPDIFKKDWAILYPVDKTELHLGEFPPKYLAELASYCLYCGVTNKLGHVVILIPNNADYLACCRYMMEHILSCIPSALRRYLSFATNVSDMESRNFAVLFAPQGTVVSPGQCALPTYDLDAWPNIMSGVSFPQELIDLIEEAAKDSSILDKVYSDVEKCKELDSLTVTSYSGFWFQYLLKQPLRDCKSLQKCSEWLSQPDITQQDRDRIVDRLRKNLSDDNLEKILSTDTDLINAQTPGDLFDALQKYKDVLNLLNKKMTHDFSSRVLDSCLQQVMTGSTSFENFEKYRNDMEKCRSLNLLAPNAFQEKYARIEVDISKAVRNYEAQFKKALSHADDIWTEEHLNAALESLSLCDQETQDDCLMELSQSAVRRLYGNRVEEDKIPEFYKMISERLKSPAQHQPLDKWYKEWKEQRDKIERFLKNTANFRDYFALGPAMKQYTESLWNRAEEIGRETLGVIDFIQAAERVFHKSWPDLGENLSALTQSFVENYKMGVWLAPDKQWNILYSELLAYQWLASDGDGRNTVYVWYEGADEQESKCVNLTELLETVDFIDSVFADRPIDAQYSSEVLRCLLSAGMIHTEDICKLNPHLRESDSNLLQDKSEDVPTATRRSRKGRRLSKGSMIETGITEILRPLLILIILLILTIILTFSFMILTEPKRIADDSSADEEIRSTEGIDSNLDDDLSMPVIDGINR